MSLTALLLLKNMQSSHHGSPVAETHAKTTEQVRRTSYLATLVEICEPILPSIGLPNTRNRHI
jgi:hypothetical protein